MVLDPEYGKLKLCRRYFGNGLGPANRTHDAVNFAVAQLGKGLLVFQELFVVKGSGHLVGEAKDFLVPGDKVHLDVFVARHGRCGRGVGSKWGQGRLSIVDLQSSIVESGHWVF